MIDSFCQESFHSKKQPSEMFYEKRRLKKGLRLQLCLKETPAQVFPVNFCEIFKNSFFTQHLRATASALYLPLIMILLIKVSSV